MTASSATNQGPFNATRDADVKTHNDYDDQLMVNFLVRVGIGDNEQQY